MRLRNNRVDASVPNPLQLKSTEDHPSVVSRPGSSLAVTPIEEPEDNDHGLSNPLPSPTATNSKLPLNIDASQNESSEVRTSAVLNRPTSLKISIHQPLSIQHSTPTLPIESSGKHKWTRKWHQMMRVYFGESYEKQDVLVTTGLILILIGFGCTLIGFYVLFDEHYPKYLMLILGTAMFLLGFLFCLLRVLFWEPRICPCLCPKAKAPDPRRGPRNSAFFTVASSAMTTATAVSIRYGKQSINEQNDPFIQNYRKVLTSPKSAANAVLFAQKLLKGLKSKMKSESIHTTSKKTSPAQSNKDANRSRNQSGRSIVKVETESSSPAASNDKPGTFKAHTTDSVLQISNDL